MALLAATAGCAAPEATLRIVTTARSRTEWRETVLLNPRGDRARLPPEALEAVVRLETSELTIEEEIGGGAGGEVRVEATGGTGAGTVVVRAGDEVVWTGEGLTSARVSWTRVEEGDAPPARREVPIPADTETFPVDAEVRPSTRRIADGVMTLSDFRTTVEVVGPGASGFEFVPSEAPSEGRVRGAVRRRR
ncbi:MAG: hypothetical protein L0216_19750 [Planctomycetales bacterium]|nr:hypothetical protein [Planctomycetales bacterium]